MKSEIWKPIKDYENFYEVSNKGNVRSVEHFAEVKRGKQSFIRKIKGKQIHSNQNIHGYLQVSLCKNGSVQTHTVHRLVLEAFVENVNKLPCINHKDENKSNNDLDNLEWCDYSYNHNYGTCIERNMESQKKRVAQIKDGVVIKIWDSTNEAGRNGYTQSSISQCCRGLRKHHKKFQWKYV